MKTNQTHFQETPERTQCPVCGTWHTDADDLCPACQEKQRNIIKNIPFITSVDFIPEPIMVYNALPEPHVTQALDLYQIKLQDGDILVTDRKRKLE